jgi:hypothetical protein
LSSLFAFPKPKVAIILALKVLTMDRGESRWSTRVERGREERGREKVALWQEDGKRGAHVDHVE